VPPAAEAVSNADARGSGHAGSEGKEAEMATVDIWMYREDWETADLGGFTVEAVDGHLGKVDEASAEVGASYLIVDTAGPWFSGKKVMLPAGVVERVDLKERKVYVDRTKDEIKNAPEFDEAGYRERGYRETLGGYYSRGATVREDVL
jgi:hypothetical protein